MFLAQVAKCYPVEMSDYPQRLVDLLKKHSTVIDPVNLKDVLLQLISRGYVLTYIGIQPKEDKEESPNFL